MHESNRRDMWSVICNDLITVNTTVQLLPYTHNSKTILYMLCFLSIVYYTDKKWYLSSNRLQLFYFVADVANVSKNLNSQWIKWENYDWCFFTSNNSTANDRSILFTETACSRWQWEVWYCNAVWHIMFSNTVHVTIQQVWYCNAVWHIMFSNTQFYISWPKNEFRKIPRY